MQLCKRKDFSDEYKGSYKNRDEYDKRKKSIHEKLMCKQNLR